MTPPITRRQFLTITTAAAGTASALRILPTRAQPAAPSKRVALGVIGLGIQGTNNLRAFLGNPEVQVVAVCDVHTAQRAKGKQLVDGHYGNADCMSYQDFRELIAHPGLDAVQITTPDHWHPLIAVEAARHGKHMYQEKPMGWSVHAAQAVARAVKSNGVVFQFGTQQRSDGRFRLACELVRNGRIGQLQTILVGVPGSVSSCPPQPPEPVPADLDYNLWLGPAPMAPYSYQRCRPYTEKDGWSVWYSISDYCMGMIGNWGVHHLDIAQWGNNTEHSGPIEIEGTAEFPRGLLTDCCVRWQIVNRYSNGVTLVHMDDATSSKHPLQEGGHGHGVLFLGTQGWVHVDRQKLDAHPASLLDSKIGPNEIHLHRSDNHGANFIDAIRGRAKPAAPIDVAVRTDTLCHLQLIAGTLRRKLRWDPDAQRFPNDDEANRMLDRPMRPPWGL
jgi:predicted dehydrogenase